mgnify:CR=1 FL=1
MTDILRDRIAHAIAQADGDLPGMEPASCDYEMADAVIAELGLQTEWGIDIAYGGYERDFTDRDEAAERLAEIVEDYGDAQPARAPTLMHRYITEWEQSG